MTLFRLGNLDAMAGEVCAICVSPSSEDMAMFPGCYSGHYRVLAIFDSASRRIE